METIDNNKKEDTNTKLEQVYLEDALNHLWHIIDEARNIIEKNGEHQSIDLLSAIEHTNEKISKEAEIFNQLHSRYFPHINILPTKIIFSQITDSLNRLRTSIDKNNNPNRIKRVTELLNDSAKNIDKYIHFVKISNIAISEINKFKSFIQKILNDGNDKKAHTILNNWYIANTEIINRTMRTYGEKILSDRKYEIYSITPKKTILYGLGAVDLIRFARDILKESNLLQQNEIKTDKYYDDSSYVLSNIPIDPKIAIVEGLTKSLKKYTTDDYQ